MNRQKLNICRHKRVMGWDLGLARVKEQRLAGFKEGISSGGGGFPFALSEPVAKNNLGPK